MSKKLYLECMSGISGDMTVAALLDLGADKKVLMEALESLPVKGFEIKITNLMKAGIEVCDFDVLLDKGYENHDHDMDYLFGKEEHHHHEHHHHEHRGMKEVIEIIEMAKLTEGARKLAKRIFTILAQAEAKAHATTLEKVHFHEVGAVDSIVDVISAAVCLDNLGIEEVIIPVLYEGTGTIRCQHGILPVPVPAVLNIACAHQLKFHKTNQEAELVTPTGAAIVAAIKTGDKLPEKFVVEKVGIGAGKRSYERPSLLRAMIIEDDSQKPGVPKDYIYKLESNIDDCSGENLGFIMDELLKAGAKDVSYAPIFMKKNRPAYLLTVICKEKDVEKLESLIFEGTTTIGIRKQRMERSILEREIKKIKTPLGELQVKICILNGKKQVYPEYSSVVEICKKQSLSYLEAYNLIKKVADVEYLM